MRTTQALLPGRTFEADKLLAPHQALAAYAAAVSLVPPRIERIALAEAFGRVLATNARCEEAVPAHDRSTMDGYAVRSADGAQPRRVTGAVRMGQAPPYGIGAGEALEIPTGGVMPAGADAVIPIEDVTREGDTIVPAAAVPPGDSVTRAGSDLRTGETVIASGRHIGGPEMGVLATLGMVEVPVYARPVVAILSTGDELVEASRRPGIGQVRDSNRWAIAGALAAMGCIARQEPNVRDDADALRAALAAALAGADAVLLTGGSSVGERDLTPRIVDAAGEPGVIVHGLRVKPGKPTVLGAVGGKPVIGLPGNPTSALTILEAVCAPIVYALTGAAAPRPTVARVPAGATFTGRAGWTWYVPAELRTSDGVERAYPLVLRSAHTGLLARAAGYVVLGEDRPGIEAGEPVDVVRLSGGGRW